MTDDENIIHVSFGRDGKKRGVVDRPPPCDPDAPDDAGRHVREPALDMYSVGEVSRLFGIAPSRLRYWERAGLVTRSVNSGRKRFYTFQDLIGIRAAKGLLEQGMPLRRVRRGVEAIRETLPRVARPLSTLRVLTDGQNLIVKDGTGSFEPVSGQLVLDFEVGALHADVVRVLHGKGGEQSRRSAFEHYLQGCKLDEDDAKLAEAEAAYRRAIELDPSFANAFINLGNLLFRRGNADDAERMYRRALRVDREQPEAWYNLGFLLYDRDDIEGARLCFERALLADPGFADAHFNLAIVLEELGRAGEAKTHWESYLELDPETSWAEIARRHLNED